MGACEDGGGVGRYGRVETFRSGKRRVGQDALNLRGGVGRGKEVLAREPDQQGKPEGVEEAQTRKEREVFVAEFSEAEAWVKNHSVRRYANGLGVRDAGSKFCADEGLDRRRVEAGKCVPLLRRTASVHQDETGAGLGVGESASHRFVPGEAADVIDDFGAGLHGSAGGGAVVGVNGKNRLGPGVADGFENGEQAGLLLGWRDPLGVWASRFRADIEDAGAEIEEVQSVLRGFVDFEVCAAVGEAIRGDVEYAHDGRLLAQPQGACSKAPVVAGARTERHRR